MSFAMNWKHIALAALTLTLAAPAAAGERGALSLPGANWPRSPQFAGATGELAARLLAAHNRERAAVGHPALQWDPDLAASAASYGPVLASLHHLVHSPRDTRPGQRENLAMAF